MGDGSAAERPAPLLARARELAIVGRTKAGRSNDCGKERYPTGHELHRVRARAPAPPRCRRRGLDTVGFHLAASVTRMDARIGANLSGRLTLGADVLLIPVSDLPDESRTQIDCEPGDFAVSRVRSRSGSKIIDADAADLLSRFRKPRTLVEAVILFGREKGLDPNEVLESAYPLLRNLVEGGVLVDVDQTTPGGDMPSHNVTHWSVGAELLGGCVSRVLQVLDDTEIYLLSRTTGHSSVLKIERFSDDGRSLGPVRVRLVHEAAFLTHLGGILAPDLLGSRELDGRAYLEIAFVPGV